jgi:hypothetical protein
MYVNITYYACVTKHPGTAMTICDILVPTKLLFLQISKQVSRFWNLPFHLGYFFWKKVLMEAWVADRAATVMEATASSRNSKFPAILIFLLNNYHFLQK